MKAYKKKLVKTQFSFHLKRGDNVFVLTGKDKGKQGVVRLVDREVNKVVVEGINIVNGKERLIHISNLKIVTE
ncbi:MAG: 50S ribosomal protein L24 [Vampirovibrio sp.]|jgi:ribosomal protein L24